MNRWGETNRYWYAEIYVEASAEEMNSIGMRATEL